MEFEFARNKQASKFSCSLIGYFEWSLKSDWLFGLSATFSLVEKMMRFRAQNSTIRE